MTVDSATNDRTSDSVTCQWCQGEGHRRGFVDGVTPDGLEFGYFTEHIKCTTCDGTGQISKQQAEWQEIGMRCRRERMLRGETIMQCADRLGVKPFEISHMENGRLDPTPLEMPT